MKVLWVYLQPQRHSESSEETNKSCWLRRWQTREKPEAGGFSHGSSDNLDGGYGDGGRRRGPGSAHDTQVFHSSDFWICL